MFGYCSSQKSKYFGYKFHAVCDKNGVFHSFYLAPAHIHDVNYLKYVKHNLDNATLIGDRRYISTNYQLVVFTYSNITLSIPMRKNKHNFVPFSKVKSKIRKLIVSCNMNKDSKIKVITLTKTSKSWDGTPLPKYSDGISEVTVLKITIPPKTK